MNTKGKILSLNTPTPHKQEAVQSLRQQNSINQCHFQRIFKNLRTHHKLLIKKNLVMKQNII